ncbi:MAG: ATP-dependent DNA helicase RecG [Eubacteriaceae bacterium]|nr:ATP-dependent DNA helicase RecG [Eubacteriaceae bacterium]
MLLEQDSILKIKGIGPKTAAGMGEMGIETIGQLLGFYPKSYKDRGPMVDIGLSLVNRKVLTTAKCTHVSKQVFFSNRSRITITFQQKNTQLQAHFYNQAFRSNTAVGREYVLYGTLGYSNRSFFIISPQIEPSGSAAYLKEGIYPVYGLPKNSLASQKKMQSYIKNALGQLSFEETTPFWILDKLGFYERGLSMRAIHFPHSQQEVAYSMRYQAANRIIGRFAWQASNSESFARGEGKVIGANPLGSFLAMLPFALTKSQKKSLGEITCDLGSGVQMRRLLQGDVGSGKTVVAMAAVFLAAKAGCQAAFCAPTEILAKQHFDKYAPLFESLGITCKLLSGSMGQQEKRGSLNALADGSAKIAIGTHALFSKAVIYSNLQLVVIDEQQRYGVAQRAALETKGKSAHVLVLSATPIPRTLALVAFNELEYSSIDTLPANRKGISTYSLGPGMDRRIFGFIKQRAELGEKSFIVCPAIDYEDMENVDNVYNIAKEALAPMEVLKATGAMHERQRSAAMEAFAYGDCSCLVATSIVEVGIDVPQATVMWVRGAERFGLSQLHQLRGRVGRGDKAGYCILTAGGLSGNAKQRLSVLASSVDGLEIARADMLARGAGELLGQKQSGKGSIAQDALAHADLFEAAHSIVDRLVKSTSEMDKLYLARILEEQGQLSEMVVLD